MNIPWNALITRCLSVGRGTAAGRREGGVKLVFVKAEIEGVRKNEGRKT